MVQTSAGLGQKLHRLVRTLRFRLAAWNALVVLFTSVLLLAGLREGVRWTLLHELDQILLEDAEEILIALRDYRAEAVPELIDELQRKAEGHRQHRWFAALVDREGHTTWSSQPATFIARAFAGPSQSHVPSLATVDRIRFVQRLAAPSSRFGAVRVGAAIDFIDADMARLDRLMFGGAIGAMVAAPLVGYWMARRAARVLGNITQTAAQLRPSHLLERLPLQGTGDELDQLAITVNGLLDRIAVYLEEKRDLLANAAHELRSPLAAIRSLAEVSLVEERSPAEYQRLLEDIIEEGTALETLVNQLLLLSETESLRLKTLSESVQLQEVVQKAVDMFQGVADSRQLSLFVSGLEPAPVLGNQTHLRQVVNNLLDNAIKYTPPGGQVSVQLTRQEQQVQLQVSDTGIGISAEDLPHVFERFFRANRARTRHGLHGTGLGLSICRAVVDAHRGSIECQSVLEQGTTFTIKLPYQQPRSVH